MMQKYLQRRSESPLNSHIRQESFHLRTLNTSYVAYTRSLVYRIKYTKEQVADAGSGFCLQLHAPYTSKNSKSVTGSDIWKSAWLKVLASKQGQVASFDQDTHVGELFKTPKGPIFSWWWNKCKCHLNNQCCSKWKETGFHGVSEAPGQESENHFLFQNWATFFLFGKVTAILKGQETFCTFQTPHERHPRTVIRTANPSKNLVVLACFHSRCFTSKNLCAKCHTPWDHGPAAAHPGVPRTTSSHLFTALLRCIFPLPSPESPETSDSGPQRCASVLPGWLTHKMSPAQPKGRSTSSTDLPGPHRQPGR